MKHQSSSRLPRTFAIFFELVEDHFSSVFTAKQAGALLLKPIIPGLDLVCCITLFRDILGMVIRSFTLHSKFREAQTAWAWSRGLIVSPGHIIRIGGIDVVRRITLVERLRTHGMEGVNAGVK